MKEYPVDDQRVVKTSPASWKTTLQPFKPPFFHFPHAAFPASRHRRFSPVLRHYTLPSPAPNPAQPAAGPPKAGRLEPSPERPCFSQGSCLPRQNMWEPRRSCQPGRSENTAGSRTGIRRRRSEVLVLLQMLLPQVNARQPKLAKRWVEN